MENTSQNKASVFLILLSLLFLIISVVTVLFYLNIDEYVFRDEYIINPVRKDVVNFESAQTLYMYVDDIKETKNNNGGNDIVISLKTLGKSENQKEVNIVAREDLGGMKYINDSINYWDLSTDKVYNIEEKPESVPDGIAVTDIVVVYYRIYKSDKDTLTEAIIKTVLK